MTKLTIFLAAVLTIFAPGHAETLGGGPARSQRQSPKAQAEQRLTRDFMSALQEAQRTGVAPEGMGFLPTDSQLIPPAVRQAARSTFRIAIPGGDLISSAKVFNNTPLPEVLRELQARPLNPNFEAADRAIYTYQVSECIRLKVKECMIFSGISFGSGFVTGDGSELRTALHVARDYVALERKGKVSSQIPLFVLDSQDKVIFGPHNLKIAVGALPEGALATSAYEGGRDSARFNLDQIVFKLSAPIARPIPIARALLRDGEAAYIIGGAKKTEDRALFYALDADGKSVRISRGIAMGPRRLMERLERAGFFTNETTTSQMLREATAVTADGAPRSSGGAIVNSAGEVVGVYTAGLPQSGAVFPFRVSYGSNALVPAK